MRILLIAATLPEIQPFIHHIQATSIKENFYSIELEDITLDILIAGAGSVPFLYNLSKHIHASSTPDMMILTGIAGTFRKDLPNGTLVEVMEEIWADTGAQDKDGSFLSMFDLGLWTQHEKPYTEGVLRHSNSYFPELQQVRSVTVHTVSGTQSRIDTLLEQFDPVIENMEGAAFYYFAGQEGIPCTQIRAISNFVEPRNRDAWEIGLAIKNLNAYLKKVRFQFSDFSPQSFGDQ